MKTIALSVRGTNLAGRLHRLQQHALPGWGGFPRVRDA